MYINKKLVVGIAILFVASLFALISLYPDWKETTDDFFHQAKSMNEANVILFEKNDDVPKDNVQEKSIEVCGSNVFLLHSKPDKPNDIPVLLLHGAAFSSQTWRKLGTISILKEHGYSVFAVDLPSYGNSSQLPSTVEKGEFLDSLITSLGISKPVIVSPSISGIFSIPFLLKHESKVGGFIPISPVIDVKKSDFSTISVPTLVVSGELDKSAPPRNKVLQTIKGSKLVIIPKGSHPCYMDNPALFHQHVLAFLMEIK